MRQHRVRPLYTLVALTALLLVATAPLALAGESEETTLTGCVEKADDGSVMLVVKDSDEKVALTGSDAAANHAGHTVRVTGEWQETEGGKSFQVSKVEHLSASCEG